MNRKFIRYGHPAIKQPCRWHEDDGIITLSVTSDGTTGQDWIERLEEKHFKVRNHALDILLSPDFQPSFGVTTEVVVLRGTLFSDAARITGAIRSETEGSGLLRPRAEVSCLIRDMFTDEDMYAMGLWWIVAMHDPVEDLNYNSHLLCVSRDCDGCRLDSRSGNPKQAWRSDGGFAFVLPS